MAKERIKSASLFYRASGYSVGAVVFDLLLSEDAALSADLSERAIQDGSSIADHMQIKMREGSLRGFVSDYSLNDTDVTENKKSMADLVAAVKGSSYDSRFPQRSVRESRSKAAWEQLKELFTKKQLVTIATTLEVYEDVIITELRTMREEDQGDYLEFELTFKQVRKAKLTKEQLTTAAKPLKGSNASAQEKQANAQISKGKESGVKS